MNNRFAPLSADEMRNSVSEFPPAQHDVGELISPVPSDAPPPLATHPVHGIHVAEWKYHDEQGRALFIIRRFEPVGGRKQIVPLSLWHGLGQVRWRWKAVPAPRPIYNLDAVAGNSEALS